MSKVSFFIIIIFINIFSANAAYDSDEDIKYLEVTKIKLEAHLNTQSSEGKEVQKTIDYIDALLQGVSAARKHTEDLKQRIKELNFSYQFNFHTSRKRKFTYKMIRDLYRLISNPNNNSNINFYTIHISGNSVPFYLIGEKEIPIIEGSWEYPAALMYENFPSIFIKRVPSIKAKFQNSDELVNSINSNFNKLVKEATLSLDSYIFYGTHGVRTRLEGV